MTFRVHDDIHDHVGCGMFEEILCCNIRLITIKCYDVVHMMRSLSGVSQFDSEINDTALEVGAKESRY